MHFPRLHRNGVNSKAIETKTPLVSGLQRQSARNTDLQEPLESMASMDTRMSYCKVYALDEIVLLSNVSGL